METILDLTELQDTLLEYYNSGGNSFQGWLLTLTEDEFAEAEKVFLDFGNERTKLGFSIIKLKHEGTEALTVNQIIDHIIETCLSCYIIKSFKEGDMKSESRDPVNDMKWEWKEDSGTIVTSQELIDKLSEQFKVKVGLKNISDLNELQ